MYKIYTPKGPQTAETINAARAILCRNVAAHILGKESETDAAKIRAAQPGGRLYSPDAKTTILKVDENTVKTQRDGKRPFTYWLEEA